MRQRSQGPTCELVVVVSWDCGLETGRAVPASRGRGGVCICGLLAKMMPSGSEPELDPELDWGAQRHCPGAVHVLSCGWCRIMAESRKSNS